MSFGEMLILILLPPSMILIGVIGALVKLAAEVSELRIQMSRPVEPSLQWRPADKAVAVYDFQTEDHEHESVTARAARTWGH